MAIGDWLRRRALLTPDRIALIDMLNGGRKISYRQWDRAANRAAHLLAGRLGVGRGDRVAVLSTNCVAYLDLLFAAGKLGAVLVNLNWRLRAGELAPLVEHAQPAVLFYGPGFAETAAALPVPGLPLAALSEGGLPDTPPAEVELAWDDPWVLCYTGGTTGVPRGAVLTYRSITANAVNTMVSWGVGGADVAILDAPLFHTGGLNVFTTPLVYAGGTSIVCPRFQPEQTFDLIRDAGVTLYFGVPTMFLLLQQHPRFAEADFGQLKLVISGGAPCPRPVFERFFERGVAFRSGYGLTEAGPNNFWLPTEDVRRKAGSVGFPLFHVDALIARADGTPCAAGEVGELLLRGPHRCDGYFRAAGAERAEPWLHTGDLAQRDEEGYFYIAGRKKELFISGGENVYPAEIEGVLHGHPAVLEAAVFGVPDPRWGEVGRAAVALRPGAAATEEDLLAYLKERLAGYKVPRSVLFLEALPKTGAGKVDRKALVASGR